MTMPAIIKKEHMPLEDVTGSGPDRRWDCRLVPVFDARATLRLMVALKLVCSGDGWEPVHLRKITGGRVLLGAYTDGAGHVREWVELWLQTFLPPNEGSSPAFSLLNHAACNKHWDVMAGVILNMDHGDVINTGYECAATCPIWVDPQGGAPWPGASTGIALCTDEAVLSANALESYAGSLTAYLWKKDQPSAGFHKVYGASPSSAAAPDWAAGCEGKVPINPAGGRMLIRHHAPVGLADYADFLGGRKLTKETHGLPTGAAIFSGIANEVDGGTLHMNGGYFLPKTRGVAGRFLETFHLKLLLFTQVIQEVRKATQLLQTPLLGLDASSFRVDFAKQVVESPVLWTARTCLVDSSLALPVDISTAEYRRYLRLDEPRSLIYRAPRQSTAKGEGTLRIRKVTEEDACTCIQATFTTDERLAPRDDEVVVLEVVTDTREELMIYGRLDATEALGTGEFRFVSYATCMPVKHRDWLNRMAGVSRVRMRFETLPHQGPCHDLYSMGVIGARILLAHPKHTLAESVDELISMAVAMKKQEAERPADIACRLADSDPRWLTALGPQHHGHGCKDSDEGCQWVPKEMWWDVIATLARFFPGAGDYSYASSYREPPGLHLHLVHDEPVREMERLVCCSRSLLFGDWQANQEIQKVIKCLR